VADGSFPILSTKGAAANEAVGVEHSGYGEQTREAFECIESLLLDGLQHGFFEISINCWLATGKKRELIIKAGKSYQFRIPENEIPR
jgi:hypothetical protein